MVPIANKFLFTEGAINCIRQIIITTHPNRRNNIVNIIIYRRGCNKNDVR